MAQLERYDEAKAILEPIVQNTTEWNEQIVCRLFLAYAEQKLGDETATFRCLWELRRAMTNKNLTKGFLARLMEIEAEVSRKWPLSDHKEQQTCAA